MRKHRHALKPFPAALAVPALALLVTMAVFAATMPTEGATTWKSSPPSVRTIHSSPKTMLLSSDNLKPLAEYAAAVEAAQAQAMKTYMAAISQASAPAPSAGPTSLPTTTTPSQGSCGAEDQIAPGPAAAAEAAGVPCAWVPTAVCEEGGRDDGNYGFFGIQAWYSFGGYGTAGAAPLSVQLAWESAHGQAPPDAPGECHGY